jgi:hypothetical protein
MDKPVSIEADMKLPIGTAGWVQLRIQIGDLAAVTEADKRFLVDVIERLGRIAGREVVPPALPAVLRGVTGGGRA